MKNSFTARLKESNLKLSRVALENYLVLLKRVCRAHCHQLSKAQDILRILNRDSFGKSDVLELMDVADYMSSQKYDDHGLHFRANQLASLIRKYPFPKDINPFQPEIDAYKKYVLAERLCARTNRIFSLRLTRKGKPNRYEYELKSMRDFISYAIGYQPNFDRILSGTGFGPGAAIGVTGNATNAARKLAASWSVTPGAYMYGYAAVMNHAQFREEIFQNIGGVPASVDELDPFRGPFSGRTVCVTYNKLTFVPKTARIHRPIAVEPLLNGFLQKGVDSVMRLDLKRIGLDLSCQEHNSEFARLGSLGGENPFVTIDLSSASDSISIGLVRELVPPDWFEFLDSIRSKSYMYNGNKTRYHKFCSMGNGFCFPLETLIFAAACHACGAGKPGRDYLVYGDDIVVRQSVAPSLIRLLRYIGFRTNRDKTFLEGPFRESCGKDWFGGVDVRPYTLDIALDSVQSIYKVLNGSTGSELRKEFFLPIRQWLLELLPVSFRFFRPYPGPEDSGIDSFGDEFLSCPHVRLIREGRHERWQWKELHSIAVPDREIERSFENSPNRLLYGALSGSASHAPYTIRRKTKTKVRLVSHPGATSLWLPAPSFLMRS